MSHVVDLIGQRFGRLVVLYQDESVKGRATWACNCDCGKATTVIGKSLSSGNTTSCGCFLRERIVETRTKHQRANNPNSTYNIWKGMRQRCMNPKHPAFKNYGGRGIKVCERWNSFNNFLEDMGERPNDLTIERENNEGNYEPGNCVWADRLTQNRNRRNSVISSHKERNEQCQS